MQYRIGKWHLPFRFYADDKLLKTPGNHPLIVYLHGSESRGHDNLMPIMESIKNAAAEKFQKDFPSFVLVPQCPSGKDWQTTSAYWVKSLINSINKTMPGYINKNKIYLMGHSLGGFGVCSFIKKFPGFFAAAVPVSGAISSYGYNKHHALPLWVVYASGDSKILKNISKKLVKKFHNFNVDVKLKPVLGSHEHAFKKMINTRRRKPLFNWLFSQELSY